MTDIRTGVVKKSISLSMVVADWADELAQTKGFGSNYSAYIADLIRRDWERENDLQLARSGKTGLAGAGSPADEIIRVISEASRKKKTAVRR
jgi:Arc/MetJ-type ribon-helix-helix transcriptional regulator